MKRKVFLTISWAMVLALCVIIFMFSAAPADQSSTESSWVIDLLQKLFGIGFTDFFVRKLAHVSEFAALGFLTTIAFCYSFKSVKKCYLAFIFSLIYAASDEIHQLFVPGRSGQIRDVFIDCCGILAGMAAVLLAYFVAKKSKRKTKNTEV